MRDQPVARPLPTHRTTQTQKIVSRDIHALSRIRTTIPAFEQMKKLHALDRASTVKTVCSPCINQKNIFKEKSLRDSIVNRILPNLKVMNFFQQYEYTIYYTVLRLRSPDRRNGVADFIVYFRRR
jgi:hypothetical protein